LSPGLVRLDELIVRVVGVDRASPASLPRVDPGFERSVVDVIEVNVSPSTRRCNANPVRSSVSVVVCRNPREIAIVREVIDVVLVVLLRDLGRERPSPLKVRNRVTLPTLS
jgi:hypothetical protein